MAPQIHAVSRTLLNQETDARFWAQTHYKIGRPLDLQDPTDRAMAKAWQDLFLAVQREDREGRLRVTFNDPAVRALLADAAAQADQARDYLSAAAVAPDLQTEAAHVAAATAAHQAAGQAARDAAARQPPTVSPLVVQAAADQAARALGQPPPDPVVYELPAHHPAVASPQAQPRLPVPAIVAPTPSHVPSPHPPTPGAPPAPPVRDVLAEANARRAPAIAVAVHEARPRETPGTTPPKVLARIRQGARDAAGNAPGDFVGVTLSPAGSWSVSTFPTPEDAARWFGDFVHAPTAFQYAAHFDRTDAGTWPRPVEETLGTREDLPPPPPDDRSASRGHSDLTVPLIVGGVALAGLAVLSMTGRGTGSGAP